ncbi:MAG: Rid family hydrolase [Actinomycetota bacterium]
MTRTSIEIESLTHQNPIPSATRCGPLIESSIIPAFDPGTRNMPDGLDAQIENLFTHMGQMLEAGGATWDDMVKVTFFVNDAKASREALNGPWVERFPDPASRPSRHNLEVPGGDKPRISCVFTAYVDR